MTDPISLITTKALSAWALKTLGKPVVDKVFTNLKERWEELNWVEASQEYCNRVEQCYGTIQVLGMTDPMPLGELFTDVHILGRMSAHCYLNPEHWSELQEQVVLNRGYAPEEAERKSGDEVAKDESRLFIIGKPGAGKTTFLKHMAVKTVNERLERLPIFIPLKDFADSEQSLLDYIVEQFGICGFPDASVVVRYLLSQGKALVLFDGLDEVQTEDNKRRSVIKALTNFGTQYPLSSIIISCRIAANDYQFEGYHYVEMADFNDQQISTFVDNWFRANPTQHKGFNDVFQQSNLQEMAKSPLLLVLLCLVYETTMSLPSARAELYEGAVDALLKKWDISRNIVRSTVYKELTLSPMRRLLSAIAAENFEKKQLLIKQKSLEKRIERFVQALPNASEQVDGTAILKAIEANHGILVERAQKVYSFSHLTFQEYFTASYIVHSGDEVVRGLFAHLHEDHWNEVFLLTAQMLENRPSFFETFVSQLNQLIEGEDELSNVLTWARKKADAVESKYKREAVISYYIWLALALALDRARALACARARARALAIALDLDLASAGALAIALDFDFDFDLGLDLDLDLDLLRASASASASTSARANASASARKMGKMGLAEKLDQLKLSEEPSDGELQLYRRDLSTLMRDHRNIGHDWKFTDEQVNKLESYLQGTLLLVNCLKVATLEDRQGILNQILQPVGEASGS